MGGLSERLSGYFISHLIFSLHLTSTWGVYLKGYFGTSSHILYLSLHLTSTWGLSERTSSENLSSQMFKCGHQKGLFTLHKTNNLFIEVVIVSALVLIMCVKAKWSTMASKSTLQHISNSVTE